MNKPTRSGAAAALAVLGGLLLSACQATQPPPSKDHATARQLPPPAAITDNEYLELPAHKALATSRAESDAEGLGFSNTVSGQPNPVAAALNVLAQCESARAARATSSTPCELMYRGNTAVHSAAELTAGLRQDRPAFIWRAVHPGRAAGRYSFLAGSIHVLKPTVQPPPSYQLAFNQADTLVLEVDSNAVAAPQQAALMQRYGSLPGATGLSELMTGQRYAQLVDYTGELGIAELSLKRMVPAMVLLQAGVLEYISMGYLPNHGLESVFRTQAGTKDVLALETIESQLQAATALPLPLQVELLHETLDEIDAARLEVSELVHAWLAGDEPALDRLFNDNSNASPAAQQWMADLLTKRNVGMADGIAELLEDGRQHFVLIGAAHLVGAGSVVALLRERGYKLEQLSFDSLTPASVDSAVRNTSTRPSSGK